MKNFYGSYLQNKEREGEAVVEACVKIAQVYVENITLFNEDLEVFFQISAQVKYDEGILRKQMSNFHD